MNIEMMSDVVLDVQNLSKRYGQLLAVNGISFSVRRQEIYGILPGEED